MLSTTSLAIPLNSAGTKRQMFKLLANLWAKSVPAQEALSAQKIRQFSKLIPTTPITATSPIPWTLHRYHWALGHESPTGLVPPRCIQLAIIGLRWKLILRLGGILKSLYSSSSHFWLLGWVLFSFFSPAEPWCPSSPPPEISSPHQIPASPHLALFLK